MRQNLAGCLLILSLCAPLAAQNECGVRELDFATAWERVVRSAPSFAAADAEIGIRKGEAEQVSLVPNPILTVQGENLGITKPSDDTDPPQTTIVLTQLVELGGKRFARRDLACSVAGVAAWEAEIAREDKYLELKQAFIDGQMAQQRVHYRQERAELAQNAYAAVQAQVGAGAVSPLEEKRARLNLMNAKMELRDAVAEFEKGKKRISLLWGMCAPDFDCLYFPLDLPCSLPCLCEFEESFFEMPDFCIAKAQVKVACQNVKLQKANRVPDIAFSVGYRFFYDSSEGGVVVGAEVPLPFFNRNQGNVKSALCEKNQSEYLLEEVVRLGREEIALSYEQLITLQEEIQILKEGMLCEAEAHYQLTEQGYRQEKLCYLELVEARKMLLEVQERYLGLLGDYHLNLAKLTRLSGLCPVQDYMK